MDASTQTVASFADFLADLTHGRIRASPILDQFDIAHPPGLAPPGIAPPGLEVCRPVHPHQISVASLQSVYQQYIQERNECVQPDQRAFTNEKLKLANASAVTVLRRPAGFFDPKSPVPWKPSGILERVGSSQSLVSTAASAIGEEQDDDEHSVSNSIIVPRALQLAPTEQPATTPIVVGVEEITSALRVQRLSNGHLQAKWSVDARRLSGKNQHIIMSPSFEICPGSSFKLMVKPKPTNQGAQSFDKADGWGSVDLKLMDCTTLAPTLRFRISIGRGPASGPIKHDFGNRTIGGLATNNIFVDLRSAVDLDSTTFTVILNAAHVESPVAVV